MSRWVIVANGEIKDPGRVRAALRADDYIVCADGGANHLIGLQVEPHLVLGDLDSIRPDVERFWRGRGCGFHVFPDEKDETDTHLILEEAIRRGVSEVLLLGGTGGRMDHTLANVFLLANFAYRGLRVRMLDERQELFVLLGPAAAIIEGQSGGVVSLLPLSEAVTGIDLEGFYYTLAGATLRLGETKGVSNRLLGCKGKVSIRDGLMVVAQNWVCGLP